MKFILLSICIFCTLFSFYSCEDLEKDLPESVIYSSYDDDIYEVEVDSTLTISPKITYDYNSNYTWITDEGELISTGNTLTLTPTTLLKYALTFTISNSRGSDSMNLTIQSMYNSTFEDLTISEDDTFNIDSENAGYFVSNKLIFEYEGNPGTSTYKDFHGFAYSNLTGNHAQDMDDRYSAYTSPDADEYDSENFVVMHQNNYSSPTIIKTQDGEDHVFGSMRVINTYSNYFILKNGDSDLNCKAFGGDDGKDKDSLVLTINGYNLNNELTGSVDFKLADYSFESNKDDYIINEWTKVDLSSIKACSTLELSLSSTDVSNDTVRTPPYVCLDEIKIIE